MTGLGLGLSAITGTRLLSPSHIVAIDVADSRLEAAKQFGADTTVNNGSQDLASVIGSVTDGLGTDVTIEAVGIPATFELAVSLVWPGGRVANIGVHGEPATLHLEEQWMRDLTITTGLVDACSTPPCCACSPAIRSTPRGSRHITWPRTTSPRPTTCSPAPPTPAGSRWS